MASACDGDPNDAKVAFVVHDDVGRVSLEQLGRELAAHVEYDLGGV